VPIRTIETRYHGRRFRSRTESRWAVFCDTLNLRWEYEEQGYVLRVTDCYLSEFKLTLPNNEIIYCEVNSDDADDFDDEELGKPVAAQCKLGVGQHVDARIDLRHSRNSI
jgi:hypothetical protein